MQDLSILNPERHLNRNSQIFQESKQHSTEPELSVAYSNIPLPISLLFQGISKRFIESIADINKEENKCV